MMFRNLAALAVEETIRGQPMDGVVLLVGCDKTTPSLLMGAASTDLPSIVVTGGPMLNGYFRGERVGSGTHLWKFSEAVKAGEMTPEDFLEAEASMSRSPGSCNTMGRHQRWHQWPRHSAWRFRATRRSRRSTAGGG
jgi:L-arabonate dehydrase